MFERRGHQRVVIVGGTRGLGLDLARAYVRRGADVALCAPAWAERTV